MAEAPQTPNRSPWIGGRLVMALLMLGLVGLTLWSAGRESRQGAVLARSSQKARLVARMRLSLRTASEAEKSAVMAVTDQSSEDFARRARAASDDVERALADFDALAGGSGPEADLARSFREAFAEYRRVDEDVLALAVQNSNLKAQALSFGEAAGALARLEAALKPFASGPERRALVAARILAEAFRIQSLHGPHIDERDNARMDALEARMAAAEGRVRAGLDALAAEAGPQDVARARAAFAEYAKATAEVLRLSRKNTNVRSLSLSLDRKIAALDACDGLLRQLEDLVHQEQGKASR